MSELTEAFGLVVGALAVIVLLFVVELLFIALGWYIVLDVFDVSTEGWGFWAWFGLVVGGRLIFRGFIHNLKD